MEKLRISANKRYFEKPDGTPFIWLADTVWTLPQRLKWDDAEYLMKKRREQGFTVLQMVALDPESDVEMRSPTGVKALENDDLTKPQEGYFKYLDWILTKAEEYGFYVLLLPVWGQLVVGDNWLGGTFPVTVTAKNAYWYGRWIGKRYQNRNNIIWCLGGDRQPVHKGIDYRSVWRRMAEGLASGTLDKELKYDQNEDDWKDILITYHACHEAETGECSTMSYWDDGEKWIQFIMLQSGHNSTPKNYEYVEKEYNRRKKCGKNRTMPVWDGEPAYEDMPTAFPQFTERHGSWMVRKRAYWALLSGAFGHTYGHCSVWGSVSEKETNEMMHCTWYEALDSEGAGQMRYLREMMESVPLAQCEPAQELIYQAEKGTMDMHIQAVLHKEKEFLCAYLPSGGTCRLKVAVMGTMKLYGWWFNTRDGKCYDENMARTGQAFICETHDGSITVTAPEQGKEKDFLLLLYTSATAVPITSRSYGDKTEKAEVRKVFAW